MVIKGNKYFANWTQSDTLTILSGTTVSEIEVAFIELRKKSHVCRIF